MSKQDSGRPNGQIESIDAEKKKSKFEKLETWAPSEDDRRVTAEDFNRFLESDQGVKLETRLKKFIAFSFRDADTIKDICQSTWVTMLTKVQTETIFESGRERYTFKVCYGLVLNERRRRKKTVNDYDLDCVPERRRASPEVIACLKDSCEKLDPREQQVFILDHYGFDDREIAELLKFSTQNVRTIRYRATQRLKK